MIRGLGFFPSPTRLVNIMLNLTTYSSMCSTASRDFYEAARVINNWCSTDPSLWPSSHWQRSAGRIWLFKLRFCYWFCHKPSNSCNAKTRIGGSPVATKIVATRKFGHNHLKQIENILIRQELKYRRSKYIEWNNFCYFSKNRSALVPVYRMIKINTNELVLLYCKLI